MSDETTSPPAAPATAPPGSGGDRHVMSVRLALPGFVDSWSHCGGLADFVARFAASDRYDPEGLTTRISSHLDEILEVLFGVVAVGHADVDVHRRDDAVEVACDVPVDDAQSAELARIFRGLEGRDLRAEYRELLPHLLVEMRPEAAILEMAGLHGVVPVLEVAPGRARITLTIAAE